MSLRITARNSVMPAVSPPPVRDTPQAHPDATPQPKPGALAFVPFEPPAGSGKLLSGFRAVAQEQGPIAAVRWLTKNSGALQALVKTPMGRAALATAALGFSVGWVAGANAPKVQALMTALQAVADQRLPADQTARQVGQVLQAALGGGQSATPARGDRSRANGLFTEPASKQPGSLARAQAELVGAKRVLAEAQAIWKQNPLNPGQREIVQAKQADVATLQGKVNVLTRAQGAGAKLTGAGDGKAAGSPSIEKPPSPTLPKEIDHGAAGLPKVLYRAGDVMREQRVNDYRNGRTTREAATRGLSDGALARMQAALDDIDRSKLPPGGVTGGRKSTVSDVSSPDRSNPTRAARRSKTERVRDISQRILKERFNGENVSARFMTPAAPRAGRMIEVATPAHDSDRLSAGSPATVGDVKRLLGGLNNSVISIKRGRGVLVDVTVESKGFLTINIKLITGPKGIKEIGVGEISVSGARTPQRNAATNEPMPDLDTTWQPLLGKLLALKIVKSAEMNSVPNVSAYASFAPADPGSGERAFQGARVWPSGGFDGPIGIDNVARVQEFLQANPGVAERVGLSFVTEKTHVLDFLADSAGNLVPEAMEFWRSGASSYRGNVNLSDKSSRSYLVYQRALAEFGLK
jgi:hypothetical protein